MERQSVFHSKKRERTNVNIEKERRKRETNS